MSSIEWTDETWNPVTGCDRVSPGCDNCYALTMAKRLKAMGHPKYQTDGDPATSGPGFGVQCHPDTLEIPLGWRKPRRVFVNSMSDLFHPEVLKGPMIDGLPFLAHVVAVMVAAPQHTFQVLTKRPKIMHAVLTTPMFRLDVNAALLRIGHPVMPGGMTDPSFVWPSNIWWGVTIESDRYTWRADHLRNTPAAVRFISAEPLLGPLPSLDLTGIDWLIAGGESGRGARPMHPDWVRDLRDRRECGWCTGADPDAPECLRPCHTAFFFKQWGEWVPYEEDPQPPFWASQHDDLVDGHHLPVDIAEPGVHAGWTADHDDAVSEPILYRRVGKKAAGRRLDGVTWDEYPKAAAR